MVARFVILLLYKEYRLAPKEQPLRSDLVILTILVNHKSEIATPNSKIYGLSDCLVFTSSATAQLLDFIPIWYIFGGQMSQSTLRTAIVGSGFTGLFTALYLSHLGYKGQIILIDRSERFVFKPLLFEFLNGQMDANQVWPQYEELLQGSGVTFVQDTVEQIDLAGRKIELASGLHYTYTHLVLAVGSTVGYFGTPGAEAYSFPFRSGLDVLALRQHLRQSLQRASQIEDSQLRQKLLTIAVIGAGPTGVELANTLADLLPNWYATLGGNPHEIRLVLMNRSQNILSGDVNACLRETAYAALQKHVVPVELLTGAAVTALDSGKVEYTRANQPAVLEAETMIWTAGTAINPLVKKLPIPDEQRDKQGRPFVTPALNLVGYPEVFAGGDCVTLLKPEPALAQVAYQQAKAIARNLVAVSAGEKPKASRIFLRGTLMKLGTQEAAAEIFNKHEVKGRIGHAIRQLTYLEMLPTPVHNLKVTTEWLSEEVFHHAKNLV
jgi:NADH dehydrogenase FAD-containing subunit